MSIDTVEPQLKTGAIAVNAEQYSVAGAGATRQPADDGTRESRIGWWIVAAFFGVFLGFAAIARLDAAAHADGIIKISGSRQVVQHREGGIVSSLHVKEGQRVRAGEILLELGGSEIRASERALASQVISLQAERARLIAEQLGLATAVPPDSFKALQREDKFIADQALALQESELTARRRALAAQKSVLLQQAAQLSQRIAGIRQQIQSNRRQTDLYGDELTGMRDLAASGYASQNRVRALERAEAAMAGDTANLAANAASAREQIGETRMQALTLDSAQLSQVSQRLRETEESLGEAVPKWVALKSQVEALRIRATASGQVVGLDVFTVGGVISPGQKLMEIVPDARPLVIEVMISPNDADDLYVGQTAEVRFSTLHERDLPVFSGVISRLSADSFTDEKTGARYFTGEVEVPVSALLEVKRIRGGSGGLKPGLPVEVLVPLRKRTLLQYLLEPLYQALWQSGREH